MLAAQGIISQSDAEAICSGLDAIGADIDAGKFTFDINDEDIHMSIESELTHEPLEEKPVTLAIREVAAGQLKAELDDKYRH